MRAIHRIGAAKLLLLSSVALGACSVSTRDGSPDGGIAAPTPAPTDTVDPTASADPTPESTPASTPEMSPPPSPDPSPVDPAPATGTCAEIEAAFRSELPVMQRCEVDADCVPAAGQCGSILNHCYYYLNEDWFLAYEATRQALDGAGCVDHDVACEACGPADPGICDRGRCSNAPLECRAECIGDCACERDGIGCEGPNCVPNPRCRGEEDGCWVETFAPTSLCFNPAVARAGDAQFLTITGELSSCEGEVLDCPVRLIDGALHADPSQLGVESNAGCGAEVRTVECRLPPTPVGNYALFVHGVRTGTVNVQRNAAQAEPICIDYAMPEATTSCSHGPSLEMAPGCIPEEIPAWTTVPVWTRHREGCFDRPGFCRVMVGPGRQIQMLPRVFRCDCASCGPCAESPGFNLPCRIPPLSPGEYALITPWEDEPRTVTVVGGTVERACP